MGIKTSGLCLFGKSPPPLATNSPIALQPYLKREDASDAERAVDAVLDVGVVEGHCEPEGLGPQRHRLTDLAETDDSERVSSDSRRSVCGVSDLPEVSLQVRRGRGQGQGRGRSGSERG